MSQANFLLQKYQVLKLHYKKMGLLNISSYMLQRLLRPKNYLIKAEILNYPNPVLLRNNASDTQIFTQIFLREELNVKLESKPKTIIDGGANIGLATVYLHNRFPNALIFAVEPDRSNFEILVMNTRLHDNIICYNNGIWNNNTKLKIINQDAGSESFVVSEFNENEHEANVISAITINDIVNENEISSVDLIKLDIEGSERKVFENNFSDWLSITSNLLIEIHNWIDSDAEKTVKAAMGGKFHCKMNGEYHFFSRAEFI